MAVFDLPVIDPRPAAQRHAGENGRSLGEQPAGPATAPRASPSRRLAPHIIGEFVSFASRPTSIRAKPQLNGGRKRRTHFYAAANPVRRHRILEKHAGRGGSAGAQAGGAAPEVAPLPVAECAPLPTTAADQSQRGVRA